MEDGIERNLVLNNLYNEKTKNDLKIKKCIFLYIENDSKTIFKNVEDAIEFSKKNNCIIYILYEETKDIYKQSLHYIKNGMQIMY